MRKATAAILAAAIGLAVVQLARADEPPKFRKGLWEFERTAGGQKMHATQCTDPGEDMRRQNEMIEKGGGCKISPLQRSGNTYSFSADCSMKTPRGDTVSFRSTSVMTVESDSAYKIDVTTSSGGADSPVGKELLTARRVGDCK
jgi:hypothetical protein